MTDRLFGSDVLRQPRLVVAAARASAGSVSLPGMNAGPLLEVLLNADCRFEVVGSAATPSADLSVVPRDLDIVVDETGDNLDRVAHALARIDGLVESTRGVIGVGEIDLGRLPMWTVHTSVGDVDVIIRFADGVGFHDLAGRSSPASAPIEDSPS